MSHPITKQSVLALALLTLILFVAAAAHAQPTLPIGFALGTDPNGEPQNTATVTSDVTTNVTVTYTRPAAELPISPSPSAGRLFPPEPFPPTVAGHANPT